jgi:radical SAM protein with 4Fe4S-binding SPASM domain
MGIRPNGDVTPCPYLPVFGGNLKTQTLDEVWRTSAPFEAIRRRNELGGRCGACELNTYCGGCRARAFGATGDLMAEDPLCSHTPGTFAGVVPAAPPALVYGQGVTATGAAEPAEVAWDADALERMGRIPAFVRGMVTRAVEGHCRKHGIGRVTLAELESIRARMPTPKVFGRRSDPGE